MTIVRSEDLSSASRKWLRRVVSVTPRNCSNCEDSSRGATPFVPNSYAVKIKKSWFFEVRKKMYLSPVRGIFSPEIR